MEIDDTKNKQTETCGDLSGGSPTVVTNKQTNQPNSPKKKASGKKNKWSPLRHFRQAGWPKRLKWIAEGVGVFIAVATLGVYVWDHIQRGRQFSMEHRPRVIFHRPPQLTGQIACDVTGKEMHLAVGATDIWMKNVRNGDATALFVDSIFTLVPEQKTGYELLDNPPSIDMDSCNKTVPPKMRPFGLNAGQEIKVHMVHEAATYRLTSGSATVDFNRPFGKTVSGSDAIPVGTTFQIQALLCAHYLDEEGSKHGTCATFRLIRKEDYSVACDGSPIMGEFEGMMNGYCEN